MIKKLSQYEEIPGFDIIASALIKENNLNPDDFDKLFPDMDGRLYYSFQEVFKGFSMLKNTEKFIEFLEKNKKKKFCILGDYDSDGVMSVVIMITTLRNLGFDIESRFVIPNRLEDGYGMNNEMVDKAIKLGAEVAITVDNGISCRAEVEYAKSKGLEVFVTDHHLPTEGLVPDCEIVDPSYNGDEFTGICGAFVAAKLCYAAMNYYKFSDPYFINEIASFAAIATVTDMMPMLGENRLLMRAAISYIDFIKEKKIWNRVLKVVSGLGGYNYMNSFTETASEDLFGFYIGPNINAVSRVKGKVDELVHAILDADQPGKFIKDFYQVNLERKRNTKTLLETHEATDDPVNIEVIDQKDFPFAINGLMGLMANKILTEEYKPALIGCMENGNYEFSCRSIPGYSIHDAFERIKTAHPELELTGGGHATAMGLRFPATSNNLLLFREYLNEDFIENFKGTAEKTYFEFEKDYADLIVTAINGFKIFGTGFKPLEFIYTGVLKKQDTDDKKAEIGDYKFKTFFKPEYLSSVGKEITISFLVKTDSKLGPYYMINDVLDYPKEEE